MEHPGWDSGEIDLHARSSGKLGNVIEVKAAENGRLKSPRWRTKKIRADLGEVSCATDGAASGHVLTAAQIGAHSRSRDAGAGYESFRHCLRMIGEAGEINAADQAAAMDELEAVNAAH